MTQKTFAASSLPNWTALFKNRPPSRSPHFDTEQPTMSEMRNALIADAKLLGATWFEAQSLAAGFLRNAFKEPIYDA
jgi:hypothetical protein